MADDFAAVAVAQHSISHAAEAGRSFQPAAATVSAADKAERGIQLLSRWAGILAFVGTVAAIAYLVF
ncbi:MAG TPA: hypothetical protein VJM79_03925 [Rhizorhapis sp.]|nr:hypothetical protein [Sphingobium sp.]HKX35798.1 hypothetical protein [Rhizorhapis sp.]